MTGENLLIQIERLRGFTSAVANIFLNVYLFKIGGIVVVSWFNVASFVALYIAYYATGHLLKTHSSRDIIRWGLAGLGLLYVLVFLLGEGSANAVIVLGLVSGTSYGFYWAGFNLSEYLGTKSGTRHQYFGKMRMWSAMVGAFTPLIAGGIISGVGELISKDAGYITLFFVLAISLFYTVLQAGGLPAHRGAEFSGSHIVGNIRPRRWKLLLVQQFFGGLWDSSSAALIPVLLFLIVTQEVTLGAVGTVTAIAIGIGSYISGLALQRNSRWYVFGALMMPLGLAAFALAQNVYGIIALIVGRACLPFLYNVVDKTYYDVMDSLPGEWQTRYHFMIEREFALGAGRLLSFGALLLFLTPQNQVAIATQWILCIAALPLLVGVLQYIIRREPVPHHA
ncbi:MAG: hypothetical protein RL681_735 [Candidatus Parcubacteria bacterium]|jgi:YQGE family putative transporter